MLFNSDSNKISAKGVRILLQNKLNKLNKLSLGNYLIMQVKIILMMMVLLC